MFSARTLSRALRSPAARTLSTKAAAPRAILQSSWKSSAFAARQPRIAAFSTGFRALEKLGSGTPHPKIRLSWEEYSADTVAVDEELVIKLTSELELENESKEHTEELPIAVQEFLSSSEFKVRPVPP